jgi:putative sigma-54 modulation protein
MELSLKGKNLEVTDAVEKHVEQKLGKLDRYLPNIAEVRVELAQGEAKSAESRYIAQVTIDHKGTLLRGEERAPDIFTAIDAVTDVVTRQIERYKGKLYGRKKGAPSLREGLAMEELGKVVKVKRFLTEPMSVDEAIEQMELLGHNFFFFFNEDTEQFNVLYRRRDGDYGLIQPEFG